MNAAVLRQHGRLLRHFLATRAVEVLALQASPLLGVVLGGYRPRDGVVALGLLLLGSGALTAHIFVFNDWAGYASDLRDPLRRVWALLIMLLALWAYASLLWAFMRDLHPEVGATAALQIAVVLLFALTVASAGPPPRAIVGALVIGLVFNAIITVVQAATQAPIGLRFLGEFPTFVTSPGASVVAAQVAAVSSRASFTTILVSVTLPVFDTANW